MGVSNFFQEKNVSSRLLVCGFNLGLVSKMAMVFHRRIGHLMIKMSQTHKFQIHSSILCVI